MKEYYCKSCGELITFGIYDANKGLCVKCNYEKYHGPFILRIFHAILGRYRNNKIADHRKAAGEGKGINFCLHCGKPISQMDSTEKRKYCSQECLQKVEALWIEFKRKKDQEEERKREYAKSRAKSAQYLEELRRRREAKKPIQEQEGQEEQEQERQQKGQEEQERIREKARQHRDEIRKRRRERKKSRQYDPIREKEQKRKLEERLRQEKKAQQRRARREEKKRQQESYRQREQARRREQAEKQRKQEQARQQQEEQRRKEKSSQGQKRSSDFDPKKATELEKNIYYGSILGLKGKVTFEEIKQAYRKEMKKYHPDTIAHLGEEIDSEIAESLSKIINEAYEYFRKRNSEPEDI